MMSSFQCTSMDKQARDEAQSDAEFIEKLPMSGSLLGDVHIDFGQEGQDPVFDEALLQYLDQFPIAPPPAEANYSPSFVEMVLKDIQTFKEEASIYADKEPSFGFDKAAAPGYASGNDEYTVEYPRYQQEQQEAEPSFPFAYNEPLQLPISDPPLSEYAAKQFDPGDFYDGQQDINYTDKSLYSMADMNQRDFQFTSVDQFPAGCVDRLASLRDQQQQQQPVYDKQQGNLYNLLFDDNSKDFSSWLSFGEDSEVNRFTNDMDPLLDGSNQESFMEYPLSPEYPLKQANSTYNTDAATSIPHGDKHASTHVDMLKENEKIEEFLSLMERIIDQQLQSAVNNNTEAFTTSQKYSPPLHFLPPALPQQQQQQQQQHRQKGRVKKERSRAPVAAVRISKADFMTTNSPAAAATLQKTQEHENPGSDASFSKHIIGTSTPIKNHAVASSSKVLSDVDNQHETSSSLYFNTRSRGRRSESSSSSKKQTKTETPKKPTFSLRKKR
ncbi:hypothetical protein [Parasitella parasitica]|uniref:Uncharacterized protein n=1 Tax=Parasitella parasitica TaxID=35722 RepID=A0A0B7NWR3_9FUNG|nr:hypothetical protein [Parasitella parasitica]